MCGKKKKKQRLLQETRILHNDQGINPRRYNNCKYLHTRSIGAPQYIRQMLTAIKGEIDSNTIIVGDFNTPLSPMDRSSKMKINKETQALNDTLKRWTLTSKNYKQLMQLNNKKKTQSKNGQNT